jgi:hypothetical protein
VTSEVRAALLTALEAFENLDMTAFIEALPDEATMFFPFPLRAERAAGKAEIRRIFFQRV